MTTTDVDGSLAVEHAAPAVTLHRLDHDAEILVVTSGWPHTDAPAHRDGPRYGIFLRRQVETLRAVGYRFDVLFVRGFASSRAYLQAAALLTRWSVAGRRYRLVHAHGGEAALPAAFYRRAPLLVSYCGDDVLGTPLADGTIPRASVVRRAVIRQTAWAAAQTITKSRQMELVLPRPLRRRNTVIPNGVDTAQFAPLHRSEARARLGWGQDERVVLFAADPGVPRKRHWLAQAACDAAVRSLPDIRLHVAADVAPADMPYLMNAADCLLLTSSIEGSPNVVKEALMCNLPVVATRAGDVEELLAPVEPSVICDSDPGALAQALVACLRTPVRSNGREVSGWLAAEAIAERVRAVYDRAVR